MLEGLSVLMDKFALMYLCCQFCDVFVCICLCNCCCVGQCTASLVGAENVGCYMQNCLRWQNKTNVH